MCYISGPAGGLDCVHLMFPVVHGAVGLVAAGSRDSSVYVWRRRSSRGGEEGRSMRNNIMYTMEGHMVAALDPLLYDMTRSTQ